MSWIELVAQRHPPKAPQGASPPENASDWFRIENNADDADATDVLIYSSIGGWFGMWADEFVDELKAVTTSKINLRLNSPGGSVFDGIAIANAIRSHPATVTVYVDSLAASIASVIAMSGDRLVMMPQSQLMVHNASGGCYGDATEMTKMADLLDKQSRNIAEAYAQHTGGSLAEWQQYMADETWFTADEALKVGLADEVVPMRKTTKEATPADEAKMHAPWDLSMYRYPGRIGAPTPVVKAKEPLTVKVELDGQNIAEHLVGGLRPGAQITAQAKTVPPGEAVVTAKTVAELSTDELMKLITDTVTAQLDSKLPAFLQPDEDDDEEDDEDEDKEKAKDAAAEEPDNAAVAGSAEEPDTPEESPPDGAGTTGTHNEADEWNSIVGLLHAPTSSCADDVFATLKEEW